MRRRNKIEPKSSNSSGNNEARLKQLSEAASSYTGRRLATPSGLQRPSSRAPKSNATEPSVRLISHQPNNEVTQTRFNHGLTTSSNLHRTPTWNVPKTQPKPSVPRKTTQYTTATEPFIGNNIMDEFEPRNQQPSPVIDYHPVSSFGGRQLIVLFFNFIPYNCRFG